MRLRKQKNQDDAFMVDLALTGNTTSTSWPAFIHRYDTAARRAWWIQNRAEILKKWIQDHPGTRPYAWWEFDAQGFRQKISGAGPGNDDLQDGGYGSENGIPDLYTDPYEIEQDHPVFEAQASFLKRHGIMNQVEINRLKTYDYDPETIKIHN